MISLTWPSDREIDENLAEYLFFKPEWYLVWPPVNDNMMDNMNDNDMYILILETTEEASLYRCLYRPYKYDFFKLMPPGNSRDDWVNA